jgi:disulfide bond formation protein DsbB
MLRASTLRKVLLIGLLTFLITSQAGSVSAGNNVWTSNGPDGGMVYALAIDPTTPSTLYAGTLGFGVFKSTNGGGNWSAVNAGLTSTGTTVFFLAIDPQHALCGDILWRRVQEHERRRGLEQGQHRPD